MANNYGKVIPYYCLNDCRQGSCPGHTVQWVGSRSSDIYSFIFTTEGKETERIYFDENQWAAMMESKG